MPAAFLWGANMNIRSIFAAVVLLVAGSVSAEPGWWYEPAPNREGIGLFVTQDMGAGSAVIWYLYREDGSPTWLIGGENCLSFPCVVPLHEPAASWMGGGLDLGEPVGSLEIGAFDGEILPASFDLRGLAPERCSDISPGGVLFRECAGRLDLQLLAR